MSDCIRMRFAVNHHDGQIPQAKAWTPADGTRSVPATLINRSRKSERWRILSLGWFSNLKPVFFVL